MEPKNYEHVREDSKLMVFFKGALIGYARCWERNLWEAFDHNDASIGHGNTKKAMVAEVKRNHLRKGG